MLGAITVLLVFQLLGEVVSRYFHLPVPGPVIGFGLLFAALLLRGETPPALRGAATGLLQHLSLLFVPAGVGVIVHLARLRHEWLAIVASIAVSTVLTVAVTGWCMQRLRPRGRDEP